MNTNSFSFRRVAWLLKINGTFTLRSHLLWVACIVAAAVAVNLLLLYDVEKTFYVLFAIFCALPLFKIYPVKYGLKYQSDYCMPSSEYFFCSDATSCCTRLSTDIRLSA